MRDFQAERPMWPYSCYGHGKEEPCMLRGTDWSPEEAQVAFMLERTQTGNIHNYVRL